MTAPVDLVQQVADLRARHSELCELMEQRRGGSEAHGEIQSVDRKLADMAPVLAAEVSRLNERLAGWEAFADGWIDALAKVRAP